LRLSHPARSCPPRTHRVLLGRAEEIEEARERATYLGPERHAVDGARSGVAMSAG
jgi:hypothetical protein